MAKTRERLGLQTDLIWNFLVFSFNEHEIEDCRKFCDEIGIRFNRRDAFIIISDKPDWLPSYRKHELSGLNRPPLPQEAAGKTEETNAETASGSVSKVKGEPSCSWHYGISVVNADGAVSPCCVPWEDKHDFGVVIPGRVKFKDIWNNGQFQKARAVFAGKPLDQYQAIQTICDACPYPPSVMNEYVPAVQQVIHNFQQLDQLNGTELEKAFHLLDHDEEFVSFCTQNYEHLFKDDFEQTAGGEEKENSFVWVTQIPRKF